jgi:hypothetical protein
MPKNLTSMPVNPDPILWGRTLWPQVRFYDKQRQIIYSVRDNDETYVYAAHQMGKDFVAGFIVLWYFLTNPVVRVVTTSVKDDHLRVLWGEIGRYIDTVNPDYPLKREHGGPLIITHREIRKMVPNADGKGCHVCKISYVRGMVSLKGEGMAGHHAPKALLIIDEASGIDDQVPQRASSWAKKSFIFGNPYGDTSTWFARACLGGDIQAAPKKVGALHLLPT